MKIIKHQYIRKYLRTILGFLALTDNFLITLGKFLKRELKLIILFLGLSYGGIFFSKEVNLWKKNGQQDIAIAKPDKDVE